MILKGPETSILDFRNSKPSYRSVIDPYARADIYIGIGQHDGEFEFELEEAYLTSLSLPYQLQIKAGKFRSNVGKINQIPSPTRYLLLIHRQCTPTSSAMKDLTTKAFP